MTESRKQYAALDTLLTGYLIDSMANYCGREVKKLQTLGLPSDFFAQIVGIDNKNIEQHLVTEFSKLDKGWFNGNKHKNLAKKLAKYIDHTRKVYKEGGNFHFNPDSRWFFYKSNLSLACEKTNAELNYISKTLASNTVAKGDETLLSYLNKPDRASTDSLTSELLAIKICGDLLKRLKARLEKLRDNDLVSDLVTKKFNKAIRQIDIRIDPSTVQSQKKFNAAEENHAQRSDKTDPLNTTSLVTALEEIENSIKNNYAKWRTHTNTDENRLDEIKTMRTRLSKDSFIWTLIVRLSPTALTPEEGHGYADAKEGLKNALQTLVEQKKTKNNTENHDAQADKKQSATTKRSSWGMFRTLWRAENPTKANYSAIAKSDDGNRSTTSQASTFFSNTTFAPENNKKTKIPNPYKLFKRLLSSANNPPKYSSR
jgi:hypothetical protein